MLLMLPGGDRARGLARMQRTQQAGQLLADEAAFQLHVVYFWYENRAADALALLGELVRQHPRNPYFRRAIAEAEAVYLHDMSASLASWRELARLADTNAVNEGALARPDAHLGYASALDAIGDTDLALAELTRLRASAPVAPWGIANRIALALGRAHDRLGQRRRGRSAAARGRGRHVAPRSARARRRGPPPAAEADARDQGPRPSPGARGVARVHGRRLGAGRCRASRRRSRSIRTTASRGCTTRGCWRRGSASAPAIAELDAVLAAAKTTPATAIAEAALLAGRLREQQRDRDGALAAYRRAAATFGASTETRNAASRAIERLERIASGPALSLKFRRRVRRYP